ncbi:MAG: substrate-binding domain-containing protein [Phycisphaerae bacterium]|nr:substrate-binding domain-containing protein [Phycisphaerae bacterium]
MCTLTAAITLLLLTGTCSPAETPTRDAGKGFIAVVGAGQNDPLWLVLRGSALQQQNFIGNVPIRTVAPPVISSHAQAQLIQKLRREGMRGLCVQVINPKAIAPHLQRLANDGVAVVTMVHPIESQPALVHCGVDQALLGESLADVLAEALKQKGTIAVVHANEKLDYTRERYEAFMERLIHYPRIKVLREFDCGGNPQRAQEMIRRCMHRFPRLNGWVAIDNWPLRGLDPREPLLPASCRLITTDPIPVLWDNLDSGNCFAMIAADYAEIARQAVLKCSIALEGKVVRQRTFLAKPRPVWSSSLHPYKIEWMEWCSRPAPPESSPESP